MANTQADLDTAIQAQDVVIQQIATLAPKIASDVAALLAKIGTPPDLANEVAAIQSQTASLTTAAQTLTQADADANK